ncbi:MAG: hypothetical protein IJO29_01485 [Oscillospiraceae bacterium]|nr:hypothetical protein [Oscillospiraceae bacterium]
MSIKTKIKAIFTIIFSSVLILSMSACKTTEETDHSSSEPTASAATTTTTTLPTTTTTTTTRKTTATSKVTTATTTTSTATTTTVPEQIATQPTTTVVTTVTTAATVVATTTTTTAAPIVTTTTAATTTKATVATQYETTVIDGETIKFTRTTGTSDDGDVFEVLCQVEEPMDATLQAYSDLAETGVLTDEIRELITQDVLNYAVSKYQGLVIDSSLYANSRADYNSSFMGGARNDHHKQTTIDECATLIDWGYVAPDTIVGNKKTCAVAFREDIYSWTDSTLDGWINGVSYGECYVGFCYFYTEDSGYNVYQVSFIQ